MVTTNKAASASPRITLALTGASGAQYGLRLLQCLMQADCQVYLLLSDAAREVIRIEMGIDLPEEPESIREQLFARYGADSGSLHVFSKRDWLSPVASGSNAPDAMVVCPASSGSLSAIANGASNNLIERAADVMLKERRRLIVVPRETPVSTVHLRHMLALSELGAVVLPAAPGFYHQPESIDDLIDFIVARILDHLQIPHALSKRWAAE
ncbi:UbiX family flavin prenyltransferase [bacterium]|nr:UbiX family flavin prenyltransferase [bacterium]